LSATCTHRRVVEYDGWPGSTLDPADDVAKRIKELTAHRREPQFAAQAGSGDVRRTEAREPQARREGRHRWLISSKAIIAR
jgi:hypothetical protein